MPVRLPWLLVFHSLLIPFVLSLPQMCQQKDDTLLSRLEYNVCKLRLRLGSSNLPQNEVDDSDIISQGYRVQEHDLDGSVYPKCLHLTLLQCQKLIGYMNELMPHVSGVGNEESVDVSERFRRSLKKWKKLYPNLTVEKLKILRKMKKRQQRLKKNGAGGKNASLTKKGNKKTSKLAKEEKVKNAKHNSIENSIEKSMNQVPQKRTGDKKLFNDNDEIAQLVNDYYLWRKRNDYGSSQGRWGRSVREHTSNSIHVLQGPQTKSTLDVASMLLTNEIDALQKTLNQDEETLRELKMIKESNVGESVYSSPKSNLQLMRPYKKQKMKRFAARLKSENNVSKLRQNRKAWLKMQKALNMKKGKSLMSMVPYLKESAWQTQWSSSAKSQSEQKQRQARMNRGKTRYQLNGKRNSAKSVKRAGPSSDVLNDYKQWRNENGYGNAAGRWG